MTCGHALDTGVYVLGALVPGEREVYERHLAGCETCRRDVAQLAVLPGLLSRLDAGTAEAIAGEGRPVAASAPETLVPAALSAARVARAVERRRTLRRALGMGLAAASLAALAGFGVRAIEDTGDRGPSGPSVPVAMSSMRPVGAVAPVTAEVGMVPYPGGTTVWMHCVYEGGGPPIRWGFSLYVVPRAGGPGEQISTWTAGYRDDLTLAGSTRFTPDQIARIELRRANGEALLIYEP